MTGPHPDSHDALESGAFSSVIDDVKAIRADLLNSAAEARPLLESVHDHYRDSARNLLHYLALRRRDLRPLQLRLAAQGLSSLGRAESHVLATVDAVLGVLHRLQDQHWQPPAHEAAVIDFALGQRLLAEHTETLLGPASPGRGVRIMVTMPAEAAHDYKLIHGLLEQGMDCMRINCAHDDCSAWSNMIEHLRRAEKALGRSCRVVMDLAGPKLRTGPLQPGPSVLRIRPVRDSYGRVRAPARVWLSALEHPAAPPSPANACLPVAAVWLAQLQSGDRIAFRDARDSKRVLIVEDVTDRGCWARMSKTAYVLPGTRLRLKRRPGKDLDRETRVGELPPMEASLWLQAGDHLILTRDLEPGRPASLDQGGRVLTPASIGCTIPEVFDDVRQQEPIWFDDGRIGGVIEAVDADRVYINITHTRLGGGRLRADKGINLPESDLRLGALSARDLQDLAFVAAHADVVELSFACSARDVEQLQRHLLQLGGRPLGLVLKIETRRGFDNLPDMLLTAMRSPACGVMIARGDLAVECGFERLSEIQEELLWICEAAHVPVIWATQVLESLAKKGLPSRAEISDAAMAHRAECVMLNKGPHALSAVRALDDILRRMQSHQTKKSSMLRELRLAHALPWKTPRESP